jgi:hypothetical protein
MNFLIMDVRISNTVFDATSIKDCGNKMKQTLQMLEIGQKAQLLRTASNNNGPGR